MSEIRLIDANALKETLKSGCESCPDANTNWCEHCCKINDFEDLIDNAPTVTERPKGDTTDSCDMNFFEPEKHMRGDAEV